MICETGQWARPDLNVRLIVLTHPQRVMWDLRPHRTHYMKIFVSSSD